MPRDIYFIVLSLSFSLTIFRLTESVCSSLCLRLTVYQPHVPSTAWDPLKLDNTAENRLVQSMVPDSHEYL